MLPPWSLGLLGLCSPLTALPHVPPPVEGAGINFGTAIQLLGANEKGFLCFTLWDPPKEPHFEMAKGDDETIQKSTRECREPVFCFFETNTQPKAR